MLIFIIIDLIKLTFTIRFMQPIEYTYINSCEGMISER